MALKKFWEKLHVSDVLVLKFFSESVKNTAQMHKSPVAENDGMQHTAKSWYLQWLHICYFLYLHCLSQVTTMIMITEHL